MTANRIDTCFRNLRKSGRKGFIAYVTAGDPSFDATLDTVLRLEQAGADIIELGIPFSDPLADGEANQRAAERALAAGATFAGVLDLVRRIRERSQIPLVFFSYMNTLYAHGFENAVRDAAAAGVDGLLPVDLSLEEAAPYHKACRAHGLHAVVIVTPTTPEARLRRIVRGSAGFVYCISREGVTGVQQSLKEQALDLARRAAAHTKTPVAIGFGVSTPDQARACAQAADAVIVGSYIVNRLHQAGPESSARDAAMEDIRAMIRAVKEI